jgi:hypothetical protein
MEENVLLNGGIPNQKVPAGMLLKVVEAWRSFAGLPSKPEKVQSKIVKNTVFTVFT